MPMSTSSKLIGNAPVLAGSLSHDLPPPRRSNPGINAALRALSIGDSVLINRIHAGGLYSRAVALGISIRSRIETSLPEYTRVWRVK